MIRLRRSNPKSSSNGFIQTLSRYKDRTKEIPSQIQIQVQHQPDFRSKNCTICNYVNYDGLGFLEYVGQVLAHITIRPETQSPNRAKWGRRIGFLLFFQLGSGWICGPIKLSCILALRYEHPDPTWLIVPGSPTQPGPYLLTKGSEVVFLSHPSKLSWIQVGPKSRCFLSYSKHGT